MRILTTYIMLFCIAAAFGQSTQEAIAIGQPVNVLYRNESTIGLMVHTRGFGAEYKRLMHVTGKRKRFFEVQALNMRHPKEFKMKIDGVSGSKSFYYGKLNTLTFFRGGFGYQTTLYERAERKSVEVRMSTSMGPVLAFAKPVYLYVYEENFTSPVIEKYDPERHNLSNIVGRAPLLYGLSNMRIYPGAYAKLGFSFEFSEYANEVRALEIGVVADGFLVPVPIMAHVRKEQVFVGLYLAFSFGRKWV